MYEMTACARGSVAAWAPGPVAASVHGWIVELGAGVLT